MHNAQVPDQASWPLCTDYEAALASPAGQAKGGEPDAKTPFELTLAHPGGRVTHCTEATEAAALATWESSTNFQPVAAYPEPGIMLLEPTAGRMIEHAPSGAYREDWRLLQGTSEVREVLDEPLLADLRSSAAAALVLEREVATVDGEERETGLVGSLVVSGDHAVLSRDVARGGGKDFSSRAASATMIPPSVTDAFHRSLHGDLDLAGILDRDDADARDLLCREYSYMRRCVGGSGGGGRSSGNGDTWRIELSTLPFLCGKEVSLFDGESWEFERKVGEENPRLRQTTTAHVFGRDLEVERTWSVQEVGV